MPRSLDVERYWGPLRPIESVVMTGFVVVLAYIAVTLGLDPRDLDVLAGWVVVGVLAVCRAVLRPPKPVRRTRSGLAVSLVTDLLVAFGTVLTVVAIVATGMGRDISWSLPAAGLGMFAGGVLVDYWRRRPLFDRSAT